MKHGIREVRLKQTATDDYTFQTDKHGCIEQSCDWYVWRVNMPLPDKEVDIDIPLPDKKEDINCNDSKL